MTDCSPVARIGQDRRLARRAVHLLRALPQPEDDETRTWVTGRLTGVQGRTVEAKLRLDPAEWSSKQPEQEQTHNGLRAVGSGVDR